MNSVELQNSNQQEVIFRVLMGAIECKIKAVNKLFQKINLDLKKIRKGN